MSAVPSTALRQAAGLVRPRRRPHLRVVGKPRHTPRYLAATLLLSAAGVFGILSLSALAAEAAFEARALEREIEDLSLRYDDLTAEVAALESPERIRDVAVGELGMVPAEQAAYLVLDEPLEGTATASRDPEADEAGMHLLADRVKQALGPGG